MNDFKALYTGFMVTETQVDQDSPASIPLQFGHAVHLPVDEADSWPDLKNRPATEDELAALKRKAAQLSRVVQEFDQRHNREEALRRSERGGSEGVSQRPHIPGGLISLIYIPLNFAERTLDERRDDEVAVAYLRVAEALVRLVNTWRGEGRGHLIDDLFEQTVSDEIVTTAADGGKPTEDRFTLLKSVAQKS